MVKTLLSRVLGPDPRSAAYLVECCDGPTNKFPFIQRQLKEELIQREDDCGRFEFNIVKYGTQSVECFAPGLRNSNVEHLIQASHFIRDRLGLCSIGRPALIPAIKQTCIGGEAIAPPQHLVLLTDHPPEEPLGDLLLALKWKEHLVPLNVVYLYHATKHMDAIDGFRALCSKSGGVFLAVELNLQGDVIDLEMVLERGSDAVCMPPRNCSTYLHDCAPSPATRTPKHTFISPVTAREPKPRLEKNTVVLAKRSELEGYFYLAKIVDSSLAHEKLVEFLETIRPEVIKCSDYDVIDISEAMKYSVFPGSRVLGKIDKQRFCPGTVLHGSIDMTTSEDERTRNLHDNLVVEYCTGHITATPPSRLVRIPESLFYWLQKFFTIPQQATGVTQSRDLDMTSAMKGLTVVPRYEDDVIKHKLDRFFEGSTATAGDNNNHNSSSSWYRHMYSHLPHFDFDQEVYRSDRELINWYRRRYLRPKTVVDSDSEEEHFGDGLKSGSSPKGDFSFSPSRSHSVRLKKSWYDQYLNLRNADREQYWYRKLLQRENEILRRKLARRPKTAPPPCETTPWRHWLKRGQEPPPELQSAPKVNFRSPSNDRSTSFMGMHVLPAFKEDGIFHKVPYTTNENQRQSVKKLLIQTDPKNPPGSREHTEAIYNKRW